MAAPDIPHEPPRGGDASGREHGTICEYRDAGYQLARQAIKERVREIDRLVERRDAKRGEHTNGERKSHENRVLAQLQLVEPGDESAPGRTRARGTCRWFHGNQYRHARRGFSR